MPPASGHFIHRLTPADIPMMHGMLDLFGEAFKQVEEGYGKNRPSGGYFDRLLGMPEFVALAALDRGTVVGGLVAYELVKFEQERSEFYIYDLAVREEHRRRGIATALIEQLRQIAAANAAHAIFVQADQGDEPAIALYSKLGRREHVLHFDIPARGAI